MPSSLGWFTEATGGTQVTANDVFTETADKTYYAHWEITEVFSVTVPVVLPLTVDENGEVHTGAAEIINGSTGEVIVSIVSAFQLRTAGSLFRLIPIWRMSRLMQNSLVSRSTIL